MKNDQALEHAIKRQEGRIKKNTYAEMQDALRGADLLLHVKGKTAQRNRILSKMEEENERVKRKISEFSAASLPANAYIK